MKTESICGHCGRACGDYAGGWASVGDVAVCHPNEPGRPDCYSLVITRQHEMACIPCAPLPDGIVFVYSRELGYWVQKLRSEVRLQQNQLNYIQSMHRITSEQKDLV